MNNFKTLNTLNFRTSAGKVAPDTLYWKKIGIPVLVKEYGAIDYIDFSPVEPHYFAVTCSVRVQIYNPITKLVAKNLSRFQENAYGGTFRKDGRLLVAGGEENYVKLFDISSKNILRSFRGHKAPVHRTFFTTDMIHIASFSDDKSVKFWDISTEKCLQTYTEHSDYIRAGCVSPVSPNIILSGGYDGIVKMYDTRTESVTLDLNHGSPVESLIYLPTGGIFISAGGTEIKVWDAIMGGKLLAKISQHHKTVTCLKLASNGKRLMSGSLDRHVKIYDIASYQVVHTIDFPNSVLSLGVSANDSTVVAGMVDGLVSIHRREDETELEQQARKPQFHVEQKFKNEEFDAIIPVKTFNVEPNYDVALRKFKYIKALDLVMQQNITKKTPHVTVAVIHELIRRKGLERALAGRTHRFLGYFVQFIIKNIGDSRFVRTLNDATEILLNVYEDSFDQFSGLLAKEFILLAKRLKWEEELTYQCLEVKGAFEMLTTSADISTDEISDKKHEKLIPSESANRHSIIHVK